MDLSQRLTELETSLQWPTLAVELERAIDEEEDATTKAAYYLKLGRVMTDKLLQGPAALRHFQNAWKLLPSSVEPLAEARQVYWELGKLKMVETVIKRSLDAADEDLRGRLLVELGDVAMELGDFDAAQEHYAAAADLESSARAEAEACLADLAVDEGDGQDQIDLLVADAEEAEPADKARLLLRASRIAKRYGSEGYEQLLLWAYQADPDNKQAAALYEELMVSQDRLAAVLDTQRAMLESASADDGPRLAFRYGARWATRHQNVELGARLLEQAVLGDPSNDAAFTYLRELWGSGEGDWARVVALATRITELGPAPAYVLAEAASIAWRNLGDMKEARSWFGKLAALAPEHPDLREFQDATGERLAVSKDDVGDDDVGDLHEVDDIEEVSELEELEEVEAMDVLDVEEVALEADVDTDSLAPTASELAAESEAPYDIADGETVDLDEVVLAAGEGSNSSEPSRSEPPGSGHPSGPPEEADLEEADLEEAELQAEEAEGAAPESDGPPPVQDDALIAELLEQAEQQQAARRNHDYVKTLVQLAEAYVAPEDKIRHYLLATEVYEKFSNAAEASKCFEAVLAIDPHHQQAITYLRDYYEKRRDWESLVRLLRSEADRLEDPEQRLAKYVEMADLATQRIKKPEVCIELWAAVRALDSGHPEALSNLATFYERARDWEQLAAVLTEQVAGTVDEKERLDMLQKLAQIEGDRLKNDEAAAEAWRQVLELSPSDRRAQENLKKKLLALSRWDDLEVLYEDSGKWDEFIRLLESQEARETEPGVKIGLLLKVADLWETKKDKLDRASRAYEKILKIDEQHLAAAEALIPIYGEAGNAKGLADAIEVKLHHVTDGDERLQLLCEVADIYETKLRKPDVALERFLQALAIAPANAEVAENTERVAGATGKWNELVEAYRSALANLSSMPDAEAEVRLRLGRVLLDELNLIDEALEQYRAVYEIDPDNQQALEALERLYRETRRFEELLAVYQKQRDLASEPEQEINVLYGIARLHEGELNDAASAIKAFWQVLDIEPTDAEALAALDRMYRAQEDWEPYASVLRRRLEIDVDEPQLIDLKYRLGQVLEKHLADPAGALEHYREILFVDPGNDAGRVALEGLLEQAELAPEVAAILAEVYEGREQWDRLIHVLEILIAAEGDAEQRVALLRKVARTAAAFTDDTALAFDAQARALIDTPQDADVRAELEELAERGEAYARLADVYREIAGTLQDAELARDYWIRLAGIQQHLGQVDEASASYHRVLEIDAADVEALDAMEVLFTETERWNDLIAVIRRRIDLAEDASAREQLFAQMANVYDARLEQPEEAIVAYNEVLSFEEGSVTALRALDDLYTRQGMFDELAENLEAQLRLADSEEAEIGLMLRLSHLQQTELQQTESAIETYRQVLERQPGNEPARAALEQLGTRPEHEVEIADILGPLYRNTGDFQRLLGVYEVQVRRSDDATRTVELLHEMATLHEDAAGALDAAFDTLARALTVDPASEATQEGLSRLAAATDRFEDLARVYESLAEAQTDVELGISLYTVSAGIYESQLGAVDNAIAHYRKIIELDPQHLEALEALESIFTQEDRYKELSQVLQQRAELVHDLDNQKAALMQAAQIEEEVLEDPERAVRVYLKILELDVEDLKALDALIRLYVGMERWAPLLETYSKKVELVFDADERKAIYYQMGAVYEREMSDVRAAIDTYQRVLEIDPDDLTALGRLDVLHQSAEDWPELLTVLQREADLAADPAESISYQYRIAELYDKRLDDVARALELYRDLLQQQSDHEPTLLALEALTRGQRDPLGAALVLEPIYEATGEWQKLIDVLEVQVKATADEYQKVELLHRVARLREDMLEDAGGAFDTYARAVAADLSNEESLQQYERLAATTGRWAELAALYDAQLDTIAEDPDRFAEVGLRLAGIYEEQLEDFENAIRRYQRVLETDPENPAAIAALDRLFEQTERWNELATVLTREAELAAGVDEILGFKFRLGQVQQGRLHEVDRAIASYGEVLAEMPEHEGALQALEALFAEGVQQLRVAEILEPHYEQMAQFDQLAGVYGAVLAHMTEPADRLGQYYRLADLHEERLLTPDAALAVYVRALQEYPGDPRTLEELERLGALVEDGWEHVANAYADCLTAHDSVEVQQYIGKRLARVFEEELNDVTKAVDTYKYVLSVVPLELDCLENLDRIYSGLEQYAELAGVLEQRVQTTEEPYQLIELFTRLGEVYEEQLEQLDDAVRAYRRIFDQLEPTNEQAQLVLERIYVQKEAWTDLYGVYARQLECAAGDFEQADICAKMARLLSDYLNDTQRAIDTWKRVLELRGEDGEALGALSDLYERTEQWGELTEVLERHMAQVIDDGEQVQVLLRRARLYTQQLGRDDAALDDYNRILDIDYANLDALYAINDIWRGRDNPQELAYALHQTIDRAGANLPAEHQVALYREVARLHQTEAEQSFEAIDAWRKLLEIDPRDFNAMAALELLLRADDRWEEVVDVKMMRARAFEEPEEQVREYLEVAQIWEHQVGTEDGATPALEAILTIEPRHDDAFEQLERLHTAGQRWEPLIELFLHRIETSSEIGEQAALLRKVAHVFDEKLGDQGQAYDALQTAFELDIADDETVAYLEKMAAATKRWVQLVQLTNGWLEAQDDPKTQITLCLRLAKWYGEDLDRHDYAQPYYQKVLSLDPSNTQVLRQMANYHKKNADWVTQGQMLTQALKVATRDGDRAAILTDLGEVLEKRMERADQGLAHYKRALDADPHYLPALVALESIHEAKGDHAALVDVLRAKAQSLKNAEQPEQAAEVHLKLAELIESSLHQPEQAIEVYQDVLDFDAGNLQAIKGLERVFNATQKWPELLGVLDMHLDVAATERERAGVLMQIAHLQEEQFLKPDLAAQRLEQVVDLDPSNQPAYVALARCYNKQRQWLELIGCLERHINATDDKTTKIELYTQIAETYAEQVQDQERALDAYLNITDLEPQHVPALDALAKLYERMDDPANAIDYMARVADLTVDGGQRVESFYRIGRQLEEKLGDRGAARERFEQALDLDPTHLPSLAALREICVDEADWDAACRYLDTEQQHTEAPRARARLLVELGRLRAEMLDQPELAVEAYQLAYEADRDNEDAALPLAREYVNQQRWREAEPLTEMLVRKSGKKERNEQLELWMLHGRVEQSLGKHDQGLKAYTAAHKLDLTNQSAIRGLADVNFELGDWAGALTNYQKVLTALGEDDTQERAEVYFRLGCVKREQAQVKQAISNFEKGLQLDAGHRATLNALADIYQAQGDWVQACQYRQQIIDNVLDGNERFDLLMELAEVWRDKVNDPAQAIRAYEGASDLRPDDHKLQHMMLQLYQKTNQWDRVVAIIQRIADGDPNPERRARYLFTMAQAYRDKLNDPYHAAELFDEALDLNPEFLDSFKRIDRIYSQLKDWGKLERSYRKMIHRIRGKGKLELEYNLWHALGLIYKDRLGDVQNATNAFTAAVNVKPDATEEHHILAELAEQAGRIDDAVASYRRLIKRDAMNADAYRRIYTLFLQQQAYDEAWCVAGVLCFLNRANEEERRFYDDWKPSELARPRAKLTNQHWLEHLFHDEEDLYIGKIFESVAVAALKAKLESQGEAPVLPEQFRQDPASSTISFARAFWWAGEVLGITPPLLYARADVPGGLVAVETMPMASVAGQGVLSGLSPIEQAFVVGKHLAMYRGEHYIKTLFKTITELTVLLFSAIKIVQPDAPAPAEINSQALATAQSLARFMEPMQREQLRVVVGKFLKKENTANIKRWAQSVETTAARAGLLLAGDLDVAKKIIAAEPQIPGDLSPQDRIKELMVFSVSDSYLRLRRDLGIQINTEE